MSDNYKEQREQHFTGKSSTPVDIKDLWESPKPLYNTLDREFEFDVDICASVSNSLALNCFTEEYSALDHEWNEYYKTSVAFINPPYSLTETFITRAAQQAEKHNITVVALVNANTDTKWFADAVKSSNEVRLITGRVGFIRPDGGKANGNPKGQCIIIWRGNCKTPCQITMVSRDHLMGVK